MATARVEAVITAQDRASSVIAGVGTSFGKLAGAMAVGNLAAQAVTKSLDMLKTAGVGAVKAAASFEQTRTGLENMLGSADGARKLLSDINKFAAETPFEFPELAQSTRMLVAFGFSAKEAYSGMKTLGDVAAAVGAPMQDLAYLYGTLRAQGRAYTVDIKQFATRGIPIYKYLAEVLGVAQTEVAGLVEAGTVGFPEVEKAFKLMTSKGEQFHGTMAKQSKTLSGLWSTLNDVFGMTARKLVGITDQGDVIENSLFDRLRTGAAWMIENLPRTIEAVQLSFSNFWNNTLKPFVATVSDLAVQVFNFLYPSLVALWNTIETQVFPTMKRWYEEVIKPLAPVVGTVLVAAIWVAINALNFLYKTLAPIVNTFISLAHFILVTLPNAVTTGFNFIKEKLLYLKNNFWETIGFIIGYFASLPFKIMAYIASLTYRIITWFNNINWANVFKGIYNGWASIMTWMWNAIMGIRDRFKAIDWGATLMGIGKGIANSILGLLEGAINGVLSNVPGVGTVSLPRFANGVQNFGGGLAMVGERGPEVVSLPRGSSVTPNDKIGGMGATVNVTFSGIFTGNEMEMRKLAVKAFQAASDVAAMQNKDITGMTTQDWSRA